MRHKHFFIVAAALVALAMPVQATPDQWPICHTDPVTMITETTATFTGVVVRDGGLICEYRFAYWQDGGERVYTDWKGPVMLGYPLTYAAKGLTPGTLYHCRAEVRDAVGNYPGKTQDFVTTARITISSVGRGSVVVPGEGQFLRPVGTELAVEAQAQEPFSFIGWTGTAVDAGMVADPTAAATTVVLKGDTTLQAVFKITKPGLEHLVHSYTFDDGTANDSVGDANGTLVGGAAVVDGALLTTAQDQWMEMSGAAIAMNTYPEVTIEAWYTPTAGANTGWSMLGYFGDSVNGLGSNGFFMTTARGDNKSRAAISIGDINTPWASESGADGPEYDDGQLHYMVATLTATHVNLYIDGVLYAHTALSAANKISGISQNFAYLAKGGYSGDPEWIGQIHEFSIFNTALSPVAVAARFKAGAVNSLVHQYTFDDGTANDSIDSANGTLVGGAKVENGALVTTAQDQWMEMSGATIAMNTYPEVTIEAWYTPTANANTSWSMLAYFGDSVNGLGSNGFFMTTARGDNKSRAAISIGDVATPWASESGADGPEYDDGKLHQMVATVTAMDITLYIDGTLLSTTALSEINKISALSQNFAYLAKGGYSGDPEWIGQIHEFSIYKRAKSELEVFDMYLLNVERFSTK